jgi:hypothetical protein
VHAIAAAAALAAFSMPAAILSMPAQPRPAAQAYADITATRPASARHAAVLPRPLTPRWLMRHVRRPSP